MTHTLQRIWILAVLVAAGLPFGLQADDAQPSAAKPAETGATRATDGAAKRDPPGGYRVVMKGQTVYWCTKQTPTGSRVRTEERCMTPDQYDALEASSKAMVEDLRRASPPPLGN